MTGSIQNSSHGFERYAFAEWSRPAQTWRLERTVRFMYRPTNPFRTTRFTSSVNQQFRTKKPVVARAQVWPKICPKLCVFVPNPPSRATP